MTLGFRQTQTTISTMKNVFPYFIWILCYLVREIYCEAWSESKVWPTSNNFTGADGLSKVDLTEEKPYATKDVEKSSREDVENAKTMPTSIFCLILIGAVIGLIIFLQIILHLRNCIRFCILPSICEKCLEKCGNVEESRFPN